MNLSPKNGQTANVKPLTSKPRFAVCGKMAKPRSCKIRQTKNAKGPAFWQETISDFQNVSLSKRGSVQNLSCENEFYLHESAYQWLCT